MGSLMADLRYAVRGLVKSPGFSVVAVLTLTLGIGANTAIFSTVDAVLLRDPPFQEPGRLVVLWEQNPTQERLREPVSAANFRDWRKESRVFQDLAAWVPWGHTLTGEGEPQEIESVRVSGTLFSLLGVGPRLGRAILAEDEQPGRDQVLVLSHAFWVQHFAADPRIIGRVLRLDDAPLTVIGVMPADFRFPGNERVAMWLPLTFSPSELVTRSERRFQVIGRLAAGQSYPRAREEMATISSRLALAHPASNTGWGVGLAPLREVMAGTARRPLLILLGAAGFVLLIACANVAHLSLARAAHRARELGIRAALGAGQLRLTRLLLAESVVLACLGGLGGVALAFGGVDVVAKLGAAHLPAWSMVRVDARVLGFAAAASALTALACGLAPAFRASWSDPRASIERGSGASASGVSQLRQILIVGEIGISFILLVGAGLLLRSFDNLVREDPGFQPSRLLAATIFLPEHKYKDDIQEEAFFATLLERVRGAPGVLTAGAVTSLPLNPLGIDYALPFEVAGESASLPSDAPRIDFRVASPDYFRTLGVPLLGGRDFGERDRDNTPRVVIINRALAQRFFGSTFAIGRHVLIGGGIGRAEIVAVVGDVRHGGLDARPGPEMYVPLAQYPHGGMTVVVRTRGDPSALAPVLKDQVRAIDPTLAISQLTTLPQLLSESLSRQRFTSILLGSFAAVALGVASLGIYGVLAYIVSQRTREIGVRMALGARPLMMLEWVLRRGLALAAIGVGVGLAGALLVTRLLAGLLHEVTPHDPTTFVGIAILILVVASLACAVPAAHAARVDPMVALRSE